MRHSFSKWDDTNWWEFLSIHCWYCLTQVSNSSGRTHEGDTKWHIGDTGWYGLLTRLARIHEVDTASRTRLARIHWWHCLAQVSNSGWYEFMKLTQLPELEWHEFIGDTVWHRFLTRRTRIHEVDTSSRSRMTRIHWWYCLAQASNSAGTNSSGWHSFPNSSGTNSLVTLSGTGF